MSPDVDFSKLSKQQIDALIDAGQDTAGYVPFQTAVAKDLASWDVEEPDSNNWVVYVNEEDFNKMNTTLGFSPDP